MQKNADATITQQYKFIYVYIHSSRKYATETKACGEKTSKFV